LKIAAQRHNATPISILKMEILQDGDAGLVRSISEWQKSYTWALLVISTGFS
jgi:hypothetical protein